MPISLSFIFQKVTKVVLYGGNLIVIKVDNVNIAPPERHYEPVVKLTIPTECTMTSTISESGASAR